MVDDRLVLEQASHQKLPHIVSQLLPVTVKDRRPDGGGDGHH
jgi:hypothetical protein